MSQQNCTLCAWRQHCAKRFSIADNGARCPDYSRDVSIKSSDAEPTPPDQKEQPTP